MNCRQVHGQIIVKNRIRMLAFVISAAFLLVAALPFGALAAAEIATDSGTEAPKGFVITVNEPEGLEQKTNIQVLRDSMVQLLATYDGQSKPPVDTQFCWQYSATGEEGSFKYLQHSLNDTSHVTGNACQFAASGGTTYYRCVLDKTSPDEQTTTVMPNESNVIAVAGADFIFTQPNDTPEIVTVLPGTSATLGPVLAETVPKDVKVEYQWYSSTSNGADASWTAIEDATKATLQTPSLDSGTYYYFCRASSDLGQTADELQTVDSYIYTVVARPLTIMGYGLKLDGERVDMPANNTITASSGSTVDLSVNLSDDSVPVTYQWQYRTATGGWFDVSTSSGAWGFRSSTLSVPVSQMTDGNRYRCVVTTPASILGTLPADPVVTLNTTNDAAAIAGTTPSPWIQSNPESAGGEVSVSVGMIVTLTAENRSEPIIAEKYLSYQWESASSSSGPFTAIKDATESTLSIPAEEGTAPTYYRCRMTNTASSGGLSAVSNTLRIVVKAESGVVFFTIPKSVPDTIETHPGDEVTLLSLAQTDDGSPVEYQWQYARVVSADASIDSVPSSAWTNIDGATKADYTAQDLQAGYYFYRATAVNSDRPQQQAASYSYRVNVVGLSTKPVVEPSGTTLSPDGSEVTRFVPIGARIGGTASLRVQASVPSDDPLEYTWYMLPSGPGAQAQLLDDSHEDTLVLQNIPASYDTCSFYCIVSNQRHRNEQTRSAAWYLSAWSSTKIPEFTMQPSGVSVFYDPNIAEPIEFPTITVMGRNSTNAVVEKLLSDGTWEESKAIELLSPKSEGTSRSASASQTYSGTIQLDAASFLLNGEYRVRLANGTATWPSLPPSATSDTFTISIGVNGQPSIESDPVDQSAPVGKEAVFSVEAAVIPFATPLVYRWQISRDGGQTFENCLEQDGTTEGSQFTTARLTEAMRKGDAPQYRCIVANAATGQWITSNAATLTITDEEPTPPPIDEDPEITVREGSLLEIEDGNIVGLIANRLGNVAREFLAELEVPEGYTLRLVRLDGEIVDEDTPVATGMQVEMVSDVDSEEIPAALTVIVDGDVAGSGLMNIVQLTTMAKALNGQKPLAGAYLKAGDFNGSGTIDIADLVSEAKLLNSTD